MVAVELTVVVDIANMQCLHPVILVGRGAVPCGKCMPCLVKKQRDWAFRLEYEVKYSPSAWFITLTYDDDHVPIDNELLCPIVSKRDIQLFMKRFRKDLSILGFTCRYFICAEYGPKTFRPHYHGIILDLPLSLTRNTLSNILVTAWQNGFVTLAPVTTARCRYVAKYCSSYMFLPKHLQDGSRKPFLLVSKKIGIGSSMLRDSRITDLRNAPTSSIRGSDGNMQSIPRYLRNKIFDDEMLATIVDGNTRLSNERYQELIRVEERMSGHELITYENDRKEQYVRVKQSRIFKNHKI